MKDQIDSTSESRSQMEKSIFNRKLLSPLIVGFI